MGKKRISIIGLGKLGSPMVAAFASRGYQVVGVDVNSNYVDSIDKAQAPVFEPRLQEFLSANKERISATQDYEKAILNSDITFIIVPTPSKEGGGFSTKYVLETGKEIGKNLARKSSFHLVVLVSTVVPGSTEEDFLPVLEKYSGKKCGIDFGLCYNPEFIALGSVIYNLLNPDVILIGEFNSRSGQILETFYQNLCKNNPPIKRMSIINAEIAKISLNAFVTMKISYANMLAELCEKVPGGNVDAITNALGCDPRIGHKYLKGALGYGGPCFPRDSKVFIYTAKKFGVSFPLPVAVDAINKRQVSRLKETILSVLTEGGKVSVLGLSYKPDTDVVEESQGLELTRRLVKEGIEVLVYDPKAMNNAKKALVGDKVIFASSLKECIQGTDVIVVAVPWKEFENINPEYLKKEGNLPVLVDCWKILDQKKYKGIVKYLAIGINYND